MKKNTLPTLFLDRDGVINARLLGAYVSTWDDFSFLPGVLEAMAIFPDYFGRIIIVTNQQGIGKGLMTVGQLNLIHQKMQKAILLQGGQVDAVLFCPTLANDPNNCRKPAPAMALEAQASFPDIDFKQSTMVGDSISDIRFGHNLGMRTVLVDTKTDEKKQWQLPHNQALKPDLIVPDLASFAAGLSHDYRKL